MRRSSSAHSDNKKLKKPKSADKLKLKLKAEKDLSKTAGGATSHEKIKSHKKSKATPESDFFKC